MSRLRRTVQGSALLLVSLAIVWALAEATLLYLLGHPRLLSRLPRRVHTNVSALYMDLDRPIIQLDPRCARYDPDLFYTLRPGHCELRAREFANHYDINRLGVRDDAASLEAPEIVVLGDSYAMGWGVEQEQSFPQLLERKTGRRVLNTGVSSYGTAREVAMLGRVDLSRVTHLILQYCDNDEWENDNFVSTGVVNDRIEQIWTAEVEAQAARNRYWFGKYTLWWIDRLMDKSARADEAAARRKKQIADMITVLARLAPSGIGRARLVVFGAETHAGWLGGFAELLRAHLAGHPELPAWIREMRIVELPPDIDSYVLDDHWTARGHAQVADALLPALR